MARRSLTLCLCTILILSACGTPSRDDDTNGTTDAGTSDAGVPDAGDDDAGEVDADNIDAGEQDAGSGEDAGTADAGEADAGECTEGPCSVDLTGEYRLCATCPAPAGPQGPFAITISNLCGCDFQACQNTDCQPVGLDTSVTPPVITVNATINFGGFPLNVVCTGPFENGEGTLSCNAGIATCEAKMLPGATGACPTPAP